MRFYRALLRLYPSAFRAEYCDELCFAFSERTRELVGPIAALQIILAALADVIPNAVAAHWEVLWQDLGYAARSLRRTPGFAVTVVLVVALAVGAIVLGLRDDLSDRSRLLVLALCGATLCILLLARANLASLFLARRARGPAVGTARGVGVSIPASHPRTDFRQRCGRRSRAPEYRAAAGRRRAGRGGGKCD